jgi:hypothetical protein
MPDNIGLPDGLVGIALLSAERGFEINRKWIPVPSYIKLLKFRKNCCYKIAKNILSKGLFFPPFDYNLED